MYLSIKQVAKLYNKAPHQVHYALKMGRIPYRKVGYSIIINEIDLPKVWPTRSYVNWRENNEH